MQMHTHREVARRGWRRAIRGAALIGALIAGAAPAFGQPARTVAELEVRGLLNVGDRAIVQERSGRTYRGVVSELGGGSLTLRIDRDDSRTDRVFYEAEIQRIRRRAKPVMAMSALAGAGTAFAITAIGAAAYGGNEGVGLCGACLVEWSTFTVPVGAGIGALIGFTLDQTRVRTVFNARTEGASLTIAPIVTRRGYGATASLRF